ncbi:MAG: ester cyclase [Planctomycetes bacterium]|nr:ester cyclase [Planctomycetota bacterium]
MDSTKLSAEQQAMVELWEAHMRHEFETLNIDATMETMTLEPFVNHVPVMTGGVGSKAVREFYGHEFISKHPADTSITPVSRTVGVDRIVDEIIYKCTHTIEMPWMLPGLSPTGKTIEVALVVVISFEGGKISGERIYWDQASVLTQSGLIDGAKLPVVGSESARKVLNVASEPSNALIYRDRS